MDARRITSADNPLVKTLIRLAGSSRERRKSALCVLDGPHLVQAFVDTGGTAEHLVASDTGVANTEVRQLFDSAPARHRTILSDRLFERVAAVHTPVGILACVAVPAMSGPPSQLGDCIMLDGLQDAGNAGSLLRSAAAAGVRTVIASRESVFLWSPRVLRAAMGAHFNLSLFEGQTLEPILSKVASSPTQVIGTSGTGEIDLFDLDLRVPTIWIFGNEGKGIAPGLAALATHRARIPMANGTESLNVGAAAAICLFEQVRQRRSKRSIAFGSLLV